MTAQAGDTASLSARKSALRKTLRQLRRALPRAARRRAARRAAVHLARVARACNARHVAAYLGLPEEIDTAPLLALLRRQRCVLYVPKLAGPGRLRFTRLGARAALRRNGYGIAEPVAGSRPARLDLIVVPVVAFDGAGRRLGMGGGYYDRLLARPRQRPWRVGFAFAAQEVARVPADAHDVLLDAVVTERGLRRFR